MKYDISFWNYMPIGYKNELEAVAEWRDAGITTPMTFEFNPEKHNKEEMLRLLDACEQAGMKAIVCDARTRFQRLKNLGEKAFKEGVLQAMADFGSHPAVFGFHVGDEPDKNSWEIAISAFRTVAAAAPHLTHFINMFPAWEEPNFREMLGVDPEHYADILIDFVKRSDAKIISFDSYGQCAYLNKEYYQGVHIKNFKIFGEVARVTKARLFVSLLSVGHWGYRVPTKDDIRWQIYTAVAHGVSGIHWFSFYQGRLDGNYRENPIDLFGNRTQTFNDISYENRVFMQYFAKELSGCTFLDVSYFGRPQGGYPVFHTDEVLREISVVVNETSVAVTRWKDGEGNPVYTFVNTDRNFPTKLRLKFDGVLAPRCRDVWIVPGQMVYIDKNKMI